MSTRPESVLVSRGVVAEADLSNRYMGVGRSLVNQRAVAATKLAHNDTRVFGIPLIDSRAVSVPILGQVNAAVVSARLRLRRYHDHIV